MNLWGKGQRLLLFFFLILIACDEESYLLGFQSPDENFKVVYAEFTLPTTVYQVDSLITSNSSGSSTNRLLVGSYSDSRFGTGTATAYTQYYPASFPVIPDTAVYERIAMTLVYDLYNFGSTAATSQTYQFHELSDSLINSQVYYSKSSTAYHADVVGTVSKAISPADFDQLVKENAAKKDTVSVKLEVDMDFEFGSKLFAAIRATDSAQRATYRNFFRWRRVFKGLAIVPVSTDKVVGFAPAHAKSRIWIYYKDGPKSARKRIELTMSPLNSMASYSSLSIDKSGTPLAGVTQFYQNYDLPGGQRYINSAAGIVTRVDMTPVYDYFQDIKIKSLNVAELSIVTEEQLKAPVGFILRAVKRDNRSMLGLTRGINESYDSVTYTDPVFMSKHFINSASGPRADALADDGSVFNLAQKSNSGTALYKGYLTSFLQTEVNLTDEDYLRYLSLIPISPEFGKSINGFYFHKDSIKLKIFYTTPIIQE
jgi:hypothetical protein